MTPEFKYLSCFCGAGGDSDGFAAEGFDVTGLDIVDAPRRLGYRYRFIQADMTKIKGQFFRGYHVIWGSPPCRDFSQLSHVVGKRWKRPADAAFGLITVHAFLDFVAAALPRFWIMENVPGLIPYLKLNPRQISYIADSMRRAFWGNYPSFLMPGSSKAPIFRKHHYMLRDVVSHTKNAPWINAKIPLSCSQAFAQACKTELLKELFSVEPAH